MTRIYWSIFHAANENIAYLMIEILEVTQPVDTVGVLELLNIVPCTISGSGLSGEFGRVLVA